MLLFHAVGDWSPAQLHVSQTPSTRLIVPEVERLIDETWQRISAIPGKHLFDGPVCRLESWSVAPNRLALFLSETSYKPFLGTNLHNPGLADRYGRNVLANPVGVSPVIETADARLVFGRRNASVAYYPQKIHPFAGALEPKDAADVFAAIHRELAEELSFTPTDIADIRCTGIAEDISIKQPELIFRAVTTRTLAQLQATIDRTEHHESFSLPATHEGVDKALKCVRSEMTPVAMASLLLWGRVRFGVQWFDARTRGHAYPP